MIAAESASRPTPARSSGPGSSRPRRDGSSWTGATGSDSTARISWAWRGSASPCRTCRCTSASKGCRTGRSGCLDPGGAGGPGPVPGRALVRPDRLAQAVPGRRAGGRGRRDVPAPRGPRRRLARRSWSSCSPRTGSAGRSSRASPGPRRRRWPAGRGRRGPGRPAVLEADRHRPDGPGRELDRGAYGVGAILVPLSCVQGLAVVAALLIHETRRQDVAPRRPCRRGRRRRRDRRLAPEGRGPLGLRRGDGPLPRGQRARGRLPRALPEARPARPRADAGLCLRGEHGRLDARRLAGGLAGRPLGPEAAAGRRLDDHGRAAGARGGGPDALDGRRRTRPSTAWATACSRCWPPPG